MGYRTLLNLEQTLMGGIPEEVPIYMKYHQPKKGPTNLDDILYRHVKK